VKSRSHLPALAGLLLLLLATILYAGTLDNGLAAEELRGGDLITHAYAQVQARPSNAPGYPIYTLGGYAWFHSLRAMLTAAGFPNPNPIPILSTWSLLWALVALWLLYTVLRFVTSPRYLPTSRWPEGGNWPMAWLMTAFFAVTYFFWYYATTTEQYTSAIAQTLAIVYLYLLWQEADAAQPDYSSLATLPSLLLIGMAFLAGVSLAHMLTVALIVPPLVIVILAQRPTLLRRGWLLLAIVIAALLPLATYAFVYLRGADHPEWWGPGNFTDARDWFWTFVSTDQGRRELLWGLQPGRAFFGNGFPELVWQELSLPILLGGLVGIAWLKRRTALLLYGTLLLYVIFCWFYRYGNWYQVILPAYPLILVGLVALLNAFESLPRVWDSTLLRIAPLALLLFATAWRAAESLPAADSRNRPGDTALDHAALLLAQTPPNASLFSAVDDALALDYLINIWGLNPTAAIVSTTHAEDAAQAGRPLLATWDAAPTLLAELNPGFPAPLHTVSPDWVQIAPPSVPTATLPATPPQTLIAGQLLLADYATQIAPTGDPVTAAPPALDVWLRWQLPTGHWPQDVAISLRPTLADNFLLDPEKPGQIIQVDAAAPMHGLLNRSVDPTQPTDAYRLPLPAPLASAADGIALLIYRPSDPSLAPLAELYLPLAQ
jgi:hypothetical protein